jgi:hypothetical protein
MQLLFLNAAVRRRSAWHSISREKHALTMHRDEVEVRRLGSKGWLDGIELRPAKGEDPFQHGALARPKSRLSESKIGRRDDPRMEEGREREKRQQKRAAGQLNQRTMAKGG